MAAFTDAQRADIYFFCGWPQRFVQVNTALEMALDRIEQYPAQQALLINALNGTPPGIIAKLRQLYDVTIPGCYNRLKADKVGSIELTQGRELRTLREEGRRLVNSLCSILGVHRDVDVFAPGDGAGAYSQGGMAAYGRGSPSGDNYVGK